MTNRFEQAFHLLREKNQGMFVPFVTLGDPTPELSLEIIRTLVSHGADALELGIPFSDPQADGPVIQEANIRALRASVTPSACFVLLEKIRKEFPTIPISLLVYGNIVYTKGIDHFYRSVARAGVDAVLIGDVPVEEAAPFISEAERFQVDPVFFAPPNADERTLQKVAALSKGYVYLLSRAGVTGADRAAKMPIPNILAILEQEKAAPSLLGFGVASPDQVKKAMMFDVGGVISGSAVVKLIGSNCQNPAEMHRELGRFIRSMKDATSRVSG